jgi:xylan 1,4-beta-xylosidase
MALNQTPYRSRRRTFSRRLTQLGLGLAGAATVGLVAAPPAYAADSTVTIRYGEQIATAGAYAYGLNVEQGFRPDVAGSPGNGSYKNNVAAMNPGIIRYHHWNMLKDPDTDAKGWVQDPGSSTYRWDATRINNAMSSSYGFGPTRMINIPGWPSYMANSNGTLKSGMYDDFATFCADLVRIVNVNQKRGVKYWEITNEYDAGSYNGNMDEIGTIVEQARAAMRQVDSSIRVGGPAFAQPHDTGDLAGFFSTAADSIDFVSYHAYGGGYESGISSQYKTAREAGWWTKLVRDKFDDVSGRSIEYFFDEYNINGNGQDDDRRKGQYSAVFDALAMISSVSDGATGTMAWSEADGWFGKLNNNSGWSRRPASYVFEMFNDYLRGAVYRTDESDWTKVNSYAVVSGGAHRFVLVNQTDNARTVQVSFQGWSPSASANWTYERVASGSHTSGSVSASTLTSGGGFSLPAHSVTVVLA